MVDYSMAIVDPMKQIKQGQDYVNQIYDHAALLDAGKKYAAGDYSGASQAIGARGDFKTAEGLRTTGNDLTAGGQYASGDYAGAQQTLAKGGDIKGAEGLADKQAQIFLKQHAVLQQTVPFLTAAAQQHPDQLSQAFDMIAPSLQEAGTAPEKIAQIKQQFLANPQPTLQMLQATAAKKWNVQKSDDGSIIAFDENNPQAPPLTIYKGDGKPPAGWQYAPDAPAQPQQVMQQPQVQQAAPNTTPLQNTINSGLAPQLQPTPNSPQAAQPSGLPASPSTRRLMPIPGGPADPEVIKQNALNRREIVINNQPAQSGASQLSADDVDLLGTQYLATGRMPALGYGKDAAAMRRQVIDGAVALQKKYGITSAAVVGQQAAIKANTQSLGKVSSALNQIASFEQTAQKNADLALSLAPKGGAQGQVPLFNRWIQAGRRNIQGDPDVAAFDLALTTFKNEYARVVNSATGGGVTTDSARQEIEKQINGAQNLQQLQRVIQVAKQDMGNRTSSLSERASFLQQSIQASAGGDSLPQEPGTSPAPQGAPAPSNVIRYDQNGNRVQ